MLQLLTALAAEPAMLLGAAVAPLLLFAEPLLAAAGLLTSRLGRG